MDGLVKKAAHGEDCTHSQHQDAGQHFPFTKLPIPEYPGNKDNDLCQQDGDQQEFLYELQSGKPDAEIVKEEGEQQEARNKQADQEIFVFEGHRWADRVSATLPIFLKVFKISIGYRTGYYPLTDKYQLLERIWYVFLTERPVRQKIIKLLAVCLICILLILAVVWLAESLT